METHGKKEELPKYLESKLYKYLSYLGFILWVFSIYLLCVGECGNNNIKESRTFLLFFSGAWLLVPQSIYDTINWFRDWQCGILDVNDTKDSIPIFAAIITSIVYFQNY